MYNAPETGNKLPCMRSNSFRSIALAVHFVNVADQLTLYLGLLFFSEMFVKHQCALLLVGFDRPVH